jgi:serine/threonine protein phosphatase 1
MGRLIAISDIHGCYATFRTLLETIAFSPDDHLVLLGDYIDRGPGSKQVLDLILSYQKQGYQLTLLKGNHEVMLLDAYFDETLVPRFIRAGGDLTLKSFGITKLSDIPAAYIRFFLSLKDYHEEPQFIFVHAGLNFSSPNPLEDREAMFWTRDMLVTPSLIGYKTVVYGHTPMALREIETMMLIRKTSYKVDIDNGCVFQREGMNQLLAYFPEQNNFVVQKNIDYL